MSRWFLLSSTITIVASLLGCGAGIQQATQTGSATVLSKTKGASQPVLGYTMNAGRTGLTAINGVSGASRLSSGIIGSGPFLASATCVQQSYALVASAGNAVLLMSLPSGQTSRLSDGIAATQRLLISPSCSSALVYATDSASAILITGLPSSPIAHPLNLGSASIAGAAVSDSGSILFASSLANASISVQLIAASGKQPQPVSAMQKYGAMIFLAGEDSAVLADAAANTVTLVSQLSTSPSFIQAATSDTGVSSPVALASSTDGRFIFVANGGAAPLLRLDRSGASTPLKIPCSCTPTELLPLSGRAIFQLSEAATGTVFALDGDATTPRTVFIPTDKSASATAAAQ